MACSSDGATPGAVSIEEGIVSFQDGGFESEQHVTMDVVAIYSASTFRTSQPITLVSIRPLSVSPELEILASRVNFLVRARDGFGVNGFPGTFCTDRWPPKGFGPSHAIEGLRVFPGDELAATFFIRPSTPGQWTSRGLEIRYRHADGRDVRAITDEVSRLVVVAAEHERDLPSHDLTCNPDLPSTWLGEDANDKVVVRR